MKFLTSYVLLVSIVMAQGELLSADDELTP